MRLKKICPNCGLREVRVVGKDWCYSCREWADPKRRGGDRHKKPRVRRPRIGIYDALTERTKDVRFR